MKTIHKITDVLEGTSLFTLSINCHGLVLQGLDNEIGNDTAVVGVHAWAKGVEDAGNSDFNIVLVLVRIHHGLCYTLSFVVAGSRANSVDVSPVVLSLWVLLWISINFAGRCE